jgi:hypothetical protein
MYHPKKITSILAYVFEITLFCALTPGLGALEKSKMDFEKEEIFKDSRKR